MSRSDDRSHVCDEIAVGQAGNAFGHAVVREDDRRNTVQAHLPSIFHRASGVGGPHTSAELFRAWGNTLSRGSADELGVGEIDGGLVCRDGFLEFDAAFLFAAEVDEGVLGVFEGGEHGFFVLGGGLFLAGVLHLDIAAFRQLHRSRGLSDSPHVREDAPPNSDAVDSDDESFEDVADTLDQDEAAGLDELGDLLVELAAILGVEAPLLGDGIGRGRDIAAAVEMGQKAVGITHNGDNSGSQRGREPGLILRQGYG